MHLPATTRLDPGTSKIIARLKISAQHLEWLNIDADETGGELHRSSFEGVGPSVNIIGQTVAIGYPEVRQIARCRAEIHLARIARPSLGNDAQRLAKPLQECTITWRIKLHAGLNRARLDLRGLHLTAIDLVGGADELDLLLPASSGTVPVRFSGGLARLRVVRPASTPLHMRISGGFSHAVLDGHRREHRGGELAWSSPASNGREGYHVRITGGGNELITMIER